ncbi:MAG TPA: dienelactone hydrolase family protein, partial [Vicinamibacteria bacterium]|nr:dienelactone hydrolase family protein [Vicinamibacteria bacterium]
MKIATAALLVLALPGPAPAQDRPAPPAPVSAPAAPATPLPRNPELPPAEEQAQAALSASPRHGEWADVALPGAATPIRTWVVYPERKDKAGVAIVIHEIYGLTDWIRGVADQLAREGFIAVAPDLVSGLGPGGGGTESAASRDDVVKLVRGLTPEEATRRLDVVRQYA